MSEKDLIKEQRGPIAWMAGNSVAANLAMVVLLVGGLLYALRIKQEVFPEFDLDFVSITVPYPGASPEEIEQGIILAVEEAVRGLDDIKAVSSSAREGAGIVTVELLLGADKQKAYQEIKQEVDRIITLPEEAERARIALLSRRMEVLSVVLFGAQDERVLRELAEDARDRLLQSAQITQVEIEGARPYEISVEISQENLRTYNLTLTDVAGKIRQAAVELPGGGIKTEGGEILLRMKERRDYGRQFADIPVVTSSAGTQVLLGEIAEITDGFADIDTIATYNSEPALILKVYRVGKETPIAVSDAAREVLADLKDILPPGVNVEVTLDRSDIYRARMNLLLRNGGIGLVLVLVLLAVFLESRLAFWVTMGIPISFLGVFIFLPLVGVSINVVSLFAFIMALGIVVDDAIVVGENVYQHHQAGMSFRRACVAGAREVAMPVTFSVLTNIAAFLPLMFVPGPMGKIFRTIPIVVVLVFLISLLECLFILPAHLAHQRERTGWLSGPAHRLQQRFSDWFVKHVRTVYGPFLTWALGNKALTLATGVAILVATIGYVASGRMGLVFMPSLEADYAVATAVLPYGTAVENSIRVRDSLLDAMREVMDENGGDGLIKGAFAYIGGPSGGTSGGHVVQITAFMRDPDVRPISTREFTGLWRKRISGIAGLESLLFESDHGGPGSGAAITVELSHRDTAILEHAAGSLAAALADFPNVKDIDDGFSPGKQQLDFTMLAEGHSLGLTARSVAFQVRASYYGAEALRQQRGRNEVKVMVRLPEDERVSEYDLEELLVRTPSGRDVPLREVAALKRGRAYTVINRRDGRRSVTVTANVEPEKETSRIVAALRADVFDRLARTYPGLAIGFEGKQADIRESMMGLANGFAMAVMIIYAMLAIPLRSYAQPAIIMVSIPFGIVGAVIGHIVMGYSLSVMSMMGVVALSGVVVNDSLILIDLANRLYANGLSPREAVWQAGIRRFRPIMLTTITTFGGLAPMIFETSMQARFLIPMALSLGFGILFATGISLCLVPCLYLIVADLRGHFGHYGHYVA